MAREFKPQIVTANDLLLGDVIYLTKAGNWSRRHEDAHVAVSADQAQTMLAHASARQDEIVGAYLAEVTLDDSGTPHPVHFREAFRTRGPSNYFHGKQAEV
ncbi:DUF2849 domain-containing protein [Salaquimonas pukyongi]|uniref:DUF2849 domain-containing protein n=1 Tax=Salaquimonas pukyongi TaxID=2712698 RepID=UPI00096BC80F|nr:DUF2849 domain-containing protein [Salaquimonas pukyongi]